MRGRSLRGMTWHRCANDNDYFFTKIDFGNIA